MTCQGECTFFVDGAYRLFMKIAGIVLLALGILGLVYGGFRIAYPDKVVDAGPLQISVTKHKAIPVPPILGAIAMVAGVGLILADQKK